MFYIRAEICICMCILYRCKYHEFVKESKIYFDTIFLKCFICLKMLFFCNCVDWRHHQRFFSFFWVWKLHFFFHRCLNQRLGTIVWNIVSSCCFVWMQTCLLIVLAGHLLAFTVLYINYYSELFNLVHSTVQAKIILIVISIQPYSNHIQIIFSMKYMDNILN